MNLSLLYAINKAFEQGKEIHLIDAKMNMDIKLLPHMMKILLPFLK